MVTITGVDKNSPAERACILPNDVLCAIDGNEISDVLDYRFYATAKNPVLSLLRNGEKIEVKLKKGEYDETGLCFSSYLMDKKKTCHNKCIFCFIDQNPHGMRDSIYFKDDDERLSFLQGNYTTLTNLNDKDIERIIKMRIMPINISVHTMESDLRCMMTGNRFAGEKLKYLKTLSDNGIEMNLQIVCCRGINDGSHLKYTLSESAKIKTLLSLAVVPCGVTKYRENLYPIIPFDEKSAADVIDIVENANKKSKKATGEGKFFCSDEFYLIAKRSLPDEEYYEGYPQYENGVGMLTDIKETFLMNLGTIEKSNDGEIHIATGVAAYDTLKLLGEKFTEKFPKRKVTVHRIENRFYGKNVTVAGLITGRDYIDGLKNDANGVLSGTVLITKTAVNFDGVFLDDMTLPELEAELGTKVVLCGNDELAEKMANC